MIMLIEEKRQQMIEMALTYGFTAKETIQCSQELDELINQYVKKTLPMFPAPEHSLSPVPQ
ncbi:aspartyl-phosphate phosphatase Spo0E family protein [Anoxybacillus sp. J5B_2022]|uniref:aspartyl-phosphate phosphatase Spo0E family protein n=1 Tax=Anoxybacillus sp. J5B_2022 TaxID=3003246 RepID=UPI002286561C|nr:aspartyl-phosphate phosphatase Spo0E family protein [Anoxybacillus sp. J5B_2022]MCZ0755375.1 aspartyl-phosphate phosphatase Spo0E family protein [Anoxybacillus sp. J5B_2022]